MMTARAKSINRAGLGLETNRIYSSSLFVREMRPYGWSLLLLALDGICIIPGNRINEYIAVITIDLMRILYVYDIYKMIMNTSQLSISLI